MPKFRWGPILVPFALSRLSLLVIGWLSQYFPADPNRPAHLLDGFAGATVRLIDIWYRSDSAYYMSIATGDYLTRGPIAEVQSNLAFFPLYPYLLRPLLFFIYNLTGSFDLVILAGVVVSNLLLIGAAILLYKLIASQFADTDLAGRSIWLLMFFPSGLFLSSFYAEPLFLFLSVAGFYLINKKKWAEAALIGCLLAMTKQMGIIFLLVLVTAYDWKQFKWREAIWFAVVPLGLLAFLFKGYALTGDPVATLTANEAWTKGFAWPWTTFLDPSHQNRSYLQIERILALVFAATTPTMIKRLPRHYWLYGIGLMVPILISGNMMAFGRHLVTDFPFILSLGLILQDRRLYALVLVGSALTLGWCMAAYSQFYAIW